MGAGLNQALAALDAAAACRPRPARRAGGGAGEAGTRREHVPEEQARRVHERHAPGQRPALRSAPPHLGGCASSSSPPGPAAGPAGSPGRSASRRALGSRLRLRRLGEPLRPPSACRHPVGLLSSEVVQWAQLGACARERPSQRAGACKEPRRRERAPAEKAAGAPPARQDLAAFRRDFLAPRVPHLWPPAGARAFATQGRAPPCPGRTKHAAARGLSRWVFGRKAIAWDARAAGLLGPAVRNPSHCSKGGRNSLRASARSETLVRPTKSREEAASH